MTMTILPHFYSSHTLKSMITMAVAYNQKHECNQHVKMCVFSFTWWYLLPCTRAMRIFRSFILHLFVFVSFSLPFLFFCLHVLVLAYVHVHVCVRPQSIPSIHSIAFGLSASTKTGWSAKCGMLLSVISTQRANQLIPFILVFDVRRESVKPNMFP